MTYHTDAAKLEELESTVAKAENINEADVELIEKAKRLIDLVQTKKKLHNSISNKELKQLEDALKLVNEKGLQKKVGEDYDRAQRLVIKLRGMERMRHEILELKQPTISEIASYKTPPAPVNMVMKESRLDRISEKLIIHLHSSLDISQAVYVVLGESKQSVHDWSLIRVLIRKLGRQSLKTRITNFQFDQCDRWRLEYAQVNGTCSTSKKVKCVKFLNRA